MDSETVMNDTSTPAKSADAEAVSPLPVSQPCSSVTDDALLSHLLQVVDNAELVSEPFPHMYFNELFPVHIYARMLALRPAADFFKGLNHKEALLQDGTSTRQVLPFNEQRLQLLPPEQRDFWLSIKTTLDDARLRRVIFDKFSAGIGQRLKIHPNGAKDVHGWSKGGLFIDSSGYRISPHRDVFTKLVTMQFYLPADDSQRPLGTALYSRDWLGRLNRELKKLGLSGLREFAHVKTFPFLPNSGYAFVVGNHSWHGREPLPADSGERYTLMHIYYLKPDVKFYDD